MHPVRQQQNDKCSLSSLELKTLSITTWGLGLISLEGGIK